MCFVRVGARADVIVVVVVVVGVEERADRVGLCRGGEQVERADDVVEALAAEEPLPVG